jgi:SAM-dependent methyltransferase
VGTIPFEAALDGKHAYGFDISPAAFAIASAKLQNATDQDCANVIQALDEFIQGNAPTEQELSEARNLGFNGKIVEYCESRTLREILLARRYFQLHPPEAAAETLTFASLLHILHGNRPYALSRRSHSLTPYKPTGPFEYRPLIKRLQDKVNRSLKAALPWTFSPGKMLLQDATGWWPREVNDLDAVITSPPFFDSTRFYLANWLRLWFAGWSARDFETRPLAFVDQRQKQSFEVYAPVLRQARERLKPGGVVVLHLGKSVKCDMAAQLKELGRRWFRVADVLDESVVHCESHGVRDKGTVTAHQYLVLY